MDRGRGVGEKDSNTPLQDKSGGECHKAPLVYWIEDSQFFLEKMWSRVR